jgi:hypothetical protein
MSDEPTMYAQREQMNIVIVGHVDHGKSTLVGACWPTPAPSIRPRSPRSGASASSRASTSSTRSCSTRSRPSRRPGHHHRRGPLLLQERPARLHPHRRPRAHRVPEEHDLGRRPRRGRRAADRRRRGRAREQPAARVLAEPAGHPPDRRGGEQDGPRRVDPASSTTHRATYTEFLGSCTCARRRLCRWRAGGRQRGRAHRAADALVRRPDHPAGRGRLSRRRPEPARPLRLPVQDIYRFNRLGDTRRIIAGRITQGTVRVGDEVLFLPSGKKTRVEPSRPSRPSRPRRRAAGESVGVTMAEQIYVQRGDVVCIPIRRAACLNRLRANLFWLGRQPLRRAGPTSSSSATYSGLCELERSSRSSTPRR